MSASSSDPARWEKRGRVTRLTTPVFSVDAVTFHHPRRGREREFVVIQAPDWVNVVALTRDHRLVMVRQFRYGIDEFSWEIPGGIMERGEDPIAAGLRELREETGYAGGTATYLGSVHPNPAIQANRSHFVWVNGVELAHDLEWDDDEEILVAAEPVDRVLAQARNGGITHALVLNALMLFEPHWQALRGRTGPAV